MTICTDEIIWDSTAPSGWLGYYPGTNNINYNCDANAYSDNENGQWFYGRLSRADHSERDPHAPVNP
ncbi:MAG: hypothetical protein WKF57_07725 [Nakamurella sp.]